MHKKKDVSVIVVTYNSEWNKLAATLKSILRQESIDFEILIADDGSEYKWNDQIVALMENYDFTNYKIINALVNQGTVKNLINGINEAKGRYTKSIAPGDLLYDSFTLSRWVSYMDQKCAKVCFGDAVYYCSVSGGEVHLLPNKGNPILKAVYAESSLSNNIFIDYLLANDTILGAAQMMDTDVMKKYLNLIVDKIRYAEDYMIRIMVFDGISVSYYPNNVVWYEYGVGISTSKTNKWNVLLKMDFCSSDAIIFNRDAKGRKIACKYKQYLAFHTKCKIVRKIYKCVLFPETIGCRIKMRFAKSMVPKNADKSLLIDLLNVSEEDERCK